VAPILQGGLKDHSSQELAFTITNLTQDVAMNCDAAADAELADVLGTVIRELIRKGILNGVVS
jgi:hypothetical protein